MLIVQFLKILGASDAELAAGCQTYLEALGYVVEIRGKWETETSACTRLTISGTKFRRRLKRWHHLDPRDIERGEGGRLIRIRSNPQLDRFLVLPAGSEAIAIIEPDPRGKIIVAGRVIKAKKGAIIRVPRVARMQRKRARGGKAA